MPRANRAALTVIESDDDSDDQLSEEADEFIEKFVAEGYERERDREEDVVRSLPFVATAFAVLVAALGVLKNDIPRMSTEARSIALWFAFALVVFLVIRALVYMYIAVRGRPYKFVSDETAFVAYANQLREYYGSALPPIPKKIVEKLVLSDLRDSLIDQYAEGVTNNRAMNYKKGQAREVTLTSMVTAMGLAFLTLALLIVYTHLPEGKSDGKEPKLENVLSGSELGDRPVHDGAAERPQDNDRTEGGLDDKQARPGNDGSGAGAETGIRGREEMSKEKPQPQQQPTQQKPDRPPMQEQVKGDYPKGEKR